MKSFSVFLDDDADDVIVERVAGPPRLANDGEIGVVSIWSLTEGDKEPSFLLEAIANRPVHLIGQYSVRYDPPRDASTGAGAKRKGDWHLMDRSGEILAWDTDGNARHGYPAGSRVPKKAYEALLDQHGDLCGLKSRILEAVIQRRAPMLGCRDLAKCLADEVLSQIGDSRGFEGLREAVTEAVTKAMDAEREACAELADHFAPVESANRPELSEGQIGAVMGLKTAAHNIAELIRERSKDEG